MVFARPGKISEFNLEQKHQGKTFGKSGKNQAFRNYMRTKSLIIYFVFRFSVRINDIT